MHCSSIDIVTTVVFFLVRLFLVSFIDILLFRYSKIRLNGYLFLSILLYIGYFWPLILLTSVKIKVHDKNILKLSIYIQSVQTLNTIHKAGRRPWGIGLLHFNNHSFKAISLYGSLLSSNSLLVIISQQGSKILFHHIFPTPHRFHFLITPSLPSPVSSH